MDLFVSIAFIFLLLFNGCSTMNTEEPTVEEVVSKDSASSGIDAFKNKNDKKVSEIPPLILPPVYEEVSVFGEETTSLSASNLQLATLLHTVSKVSGLNLIIDHDVPTDMPITISVHDAKVEEVLDILMDISGCYYELNGNILHVKLFASRTFLIPYTHTTSSFKTDLGGDVLNSASQGGGSSSGGGGSGGGIGIKGDFSLKFDNPDEINTFYKQIESNIIALLSKEGHYTLNKFSGVLNVYDKHQNVEAIEKFLNKIKKQVNRQVLIEAKIMEVILNDSHSLGVSWEAVVDNVAKAGDQLLLQQGLALVGSVAGSITYTNDNFTAILNALDASGDVDTLSNPRIKVLSGQSAIISSGKLVPFWEKEVQTNQGTGGSASNTEVTYNRRDVLHGLTMGVTPTIMEDGKIMLNVIPITSSIEDIVEHFDEDGKNVATAPILNIKEAGTIIYAKNNDLVLIGGLINNTVSKKDTSIPLLGDIPWIGSLFKTTERKNEKRELVILIRLQVIE